MGIQLNLPKEFTEILENQVQSIYLEALNTARNDIGAIREYLSIEEVCKLMHISRNTLKNWIELGLPRYQIEGKQFIKRTELNNFISQHQV